MRRPHYSSTLLHPDTSVIWATLKPYLGSLPEVNLVQADVQKSAYKLHK